jgi:site-specific recombinase XerD
MRGAPGFRRLPPTDTAALVRIAAPPPATLPATLSRLVEPFLLWLATVRGRLPRTIDAYRKDLTCAVRFFATHGREDPRTIGHGHIEAYLAWLQLTAGRSATTAVRRLHALRSFFKFLVREGLVDRDVAAVAFAPKVPRHRLPDYLTVVEQERALAALAADGSLRGRRDHALIATALLTGLRVSELAALQLAHVNLEAGVLRVVQGKGGKDREVPIIPRLRAILDAYLREVRPRLLAVPQGLGGVFRHPESANLRIRYMHRGRRVDMSARSPREADARQLLAAHRAALDPDASPYVFVSASPKRGWRDRRAGLPLQTRALWWTIHHRLSPLVGRPIHPHALRHSYAARLRAAGADLQLVQECLGHESITTTTIYAHLSTPARLASVARLLEAGAGGLTS